MIGDAPPSPITQIPGWQTDAEEAALIDLARAVPANGLILEIGAEWGRSAAAFALGSVQSVEIISVDLFPDAVLDAHRANLAEAGLSGRSEQVISDSQAYKLKKTTKINLLFIDGDHTYEGVKADLERYAPHVPVGGRMALHDVASMTNRDPHYLHFEVTRALSEFMLASGGAWKHVGGVDSLIVFERVK